MWGQAHSKHAVTRIVGIIPTRVGTSNIKITNNVIYKDHPHACGDKTKLSHSFHKSTGSSPRVWGQAYSGSDVTTPKGIIPTRVGTSLSLLPFGLSLWDHPHACGDKTFSKNTGRCLQGSSPRVWGQVEGVPSRFIVYRIIPTRVGTSSIARGEHKQVRDHPHACGDKINIGLKLYLQQGSSPRVWGQASKSMSAGIISRIIPTRVGTSAQSQRRKSYN